MIGYSKTSFYRGKKSIHAFHPFLVFMLNIPILFLQELFLVIIIQLS